MSASPVSISRLACMAASSEEPHRRLIVEPGTDVGKPFKSHAMRATLRLSSPAWLAQPKKTSSSRDQSALGLRATNALMGTAARSSVRTLASAPP